MNEESIVDVIKELSCNSIAGPDSVPVTLLKTFISRACQAIEYSLQPLNQYGSISIYMERSGRGVDRSLAKNNWPISLTGGPNVDQL